VSRAVAPRDLLDDMKALPRPTRAQRAAFARHVCGAHSWYKHLSLVRGAELVVFVAPDAGAGYETHARIHHTWTTTSEYRARFGHLDYAWRVDPEAGWQRDGVHPAELVLPASVWRDCGFRLFPQCSTDMNAIEVICSFWGERGDDGWYPDEQAQLDDATRARVRALELAYTAYGDAYGEADDVVVQRLERELDALYDAWRAPEVAKIDAALDALERLLA
jgi:hypothetical protein